jgi:hypothetical protein
VSSALQIVDTVRFKRGFLQSTAMGSGPPAPTSLGPCARGTVTAIAPLSPSSPLLLATVAWADGDSTRVNVANLERQPDTVPLQGR